MTASYAGVVFDKDGTLLDFAATGNPAIGLAIETIADGDEAAACGIADARGYDLGERLPDLLAANVLDSITAAAHADAALGALGDHPQRHPTSKPAQPLVSDASGDEPA